MDRPVINDNFETNVPGVFVIGDLAGAPVVKLAMEQGWNAARFIAGLPDAKGGDPSVFDVLVVGAGAAGLNAALELKARGLHVLVIDKHKLGSTVAELPEGKWIYTE
ncbi:MAG TPA: FAD-dependent oxidoreductase, partial [Bryobacteraceae bacterium]|nr:FAD-dependent oxidoreductase [Bryobacteraceae bacterium]